MGQYVVDGQTIEETIWHKIDGILRKGATLLGGGSFSMTYPPKGASPGKVVLISFTFWTNVITVFLKKYIETIFAFQALSALTRKFGDVFFALSNRSINL